MDEDRQRRLTAKDHMGSWGKSLKKKTETFGKKLSSVFSKEDQGVEDTKQSSKKVDKDEESKIQKPKQIQEGHTGSDETGNSGPSNPRSVPDSYGTNRSIPIQGIGQALERYKSTGDSSKADVNLKARAPSPTIDELISKFNNLINWASSLPLSMRPPPSREQRTSVRENPIKIEGFLDLRNPRRLVPALDALAGCLVVEGKGDCVSIATRIHPGQCELILANNTEVSSATLDLVNTLWNGLQKISSIFKAELKATQTLHSTPTKNDLSQDSRREIKALEIELSEAVLTANFEKFRSRIGKKLESLKLKWPIKENAEQLPPIVEDFRWIVETLEHFHQMLNIKLRQPTKKEGAWELIIKYSKNILKTCDRMEGKLSDVVVLNNFFEALDIEGPAPRLEDLYADVRKSIRIFIDLKILFAFSRSATGGALLEKDLEAKVVFPLLLKSHKTVMPKNARAWKEMADNCLKERNDLCKNKREPNQESLPAKKWIDRHKENLSLFPAKLLHRRQDHAMVHCEAKIIAHILRDRIERQDLPFYGYIGCSKLSCLCCASLLEAVNKVCATNFNMKGSHYKIYVPWEIPDLSFMPERLKKDITSRLFRTVNWEFWSRCSLVEDDLGSGLEDSEAGKTKDDDSDSSLNMGHDLAELDELDEEADW